MHFKEISSNLNVLKLCKKKKKKIQPINRKYGNAQ